VSSKAKAEAVVYGLNKLGELLGGTKAERLARAAEQGYKGGYYHGAGEKWWDEAWQAENIGDDVMASDRAFIPTDAMDGLPIGVSLTPSKETAQAYANMAKNQGYGPGAVGEFMVRGKIHPNYFKAQDAADRAGLPLAEYLQKGKYTGVYHPEYDEVRMLGNNNIRSVNANFDPAKADSSDLLAGIANVAAPLLKTAVGTGAAYTAAGALAPQEAEAGPIKVLSHIDDAGRAVYKTVIDAWHGSPHKFPPTERNPLGEFDISKIGTGEGAQAYGHGLYFADAKETGQTYRAQLTEGKRRNILKNRLDMPPGYDYEAELFVDQLATNKGNIGTTLDDLKRYAESFRSDGDQQTYNRLMGFHGRVESKYPRNTNLQLEDDMGALYRAQIDVDPDTLLDWDKPLSEQTQFVRDALKRLGIEHGSGKDVVDHLGGKTGNTYLLDAGIPGIRYADGMTRNSAGEKSYNYVMFDDKPINIVERGNANPLLLGGAALATGGAMALGAQEAEASFIGQAAKTWPAVMEAFARKMKHEGVSRNEIWQKTGIDLDNVDGLPRMEIPDNPSLVTANKRHDGPLAGYYQNDEAYRAYPDIEQKTQLTLDPDGSGASYVPGLDRIVVRGANETGPYPASAATHEVQHAIQEREGFALGGNLDTAQKYYWDSDKEAIKRRRHRSRSPQRPIHRGRIPPENDRRRAQGYTSVGDCRRTRIRADCQDARQRHPLNPSRHSSRYRRRDGSVWL
jgi:hypothetical protein